MRLKEFMQKTGLSNKTAHWLHAHVFEEHEKTPSGRRIFTDEHVRWVLDRQPSCYPRDGEELVHIPGSTYYVSNRGVVYNYKRKFLEAQKPNVNFGYEIVHLHINGSIVYWRVSRLVATYFVSNPEDKPVVNHIDGNKRNNDCRNLEWTTISENTKHAFDHGLAHNDKGFADS